MITDGAAADTPGDDIIKDQEWWGTVRKRIEQSEYRFDVAKMGFEAFNRAHRLNFALNDGVADYYYKFGFVLYQMNQFDQAETQLRRAIELDPTLYKAYYRLGRVYEALDRAEDALRMYTESINHNPRYGG